MVFFFFFFFKQKTAYEMLRSLVGSEMCIRDSINAEYGENGLPCHGNKRPILPQGNHTGTRARRRRGSVPPTSTRTCPRLQLHSSPLTGNNLRLLCPSRRLHIFRLCNRNRNRSQWVRTSSPSPSTKRSSQWSKMCSRRERCPASWA
eukprot:TRINITY_DN3689_c0_g1_i3.p2 TRINITY_DN3689_c0_g1~~TRINITY_DN3689_c0_g1_i3.p2  ORF type:complete len:147 (+),score=30.40 TRINITY_DN3689_c0_g1_i3:67-507(+)